RVRRVLRTFEPLAPRVRTLCVERVVERRLVRFVVGRQRAVLEPVRDEEPAAAVRLHDERVVPGDRVGALRVVPRLVARLLLLVEVRDVGTRPLFLFIVPPYVSLSL